MLSVVSLQLAKDLLHPSPEEEKRRHKKKRLVQSPNSYFMDVKCPGQFVDMATWPNPHVWIIYIWKKVSKYNFFLCAITLE